MSPAAGVLLCAGVAVLALCAAGLLAFRAPIDRLHYLGPAGLGVALIVAAVWVQEGPSLIGVKGALLAGVVLLTSPVLAHATAGAIHRDDPTPAEDAEVEEP